MLLAKAANGVTIRVAIVGRPVAGPVLALGVEVLEERLKGRVLLERFSPSRTEGGERRVGRVGEPRPQLAKNRALDGPRCGMVDEIVAPQLIEFGCDLGFVEVSRGRARAELGDLRRINEDRIDEEARRRRVGRDLAAIRGKQSVEGRKAEEGRPDPARALGEIADVREIADAVVAVGAQTIHLGRHAKAATSLQQSVRKKAAVGRGEDRRMGCRAAAFDIEAVITGGKRIQDNRRAGAVAA